MKNEDLLNGSLVELGNVTPTMGAEIIFSGLHYQVLHVAPPHERRPHRRKNSAVAHPGLWRVLVCTVT
jgi:hypothetical protein